MKRLKYILIGVAVAFLIAVVVAHFTEPAEPKSDTEKVDWYEQCLTNATKADWRALYSNPNPVSCLGKPVYVEGEVASFHMSPIGHCSFFVLAEDDGFPWFVDTSLTICPGVESNCLYLFEGMKVKVWGYTSVFAPVPEIVTAESFIFEISACEIEWR